MQVLNCVKFHLKIIGCLSVDTKNWPSWCPKVLINQMHISLIYMALVVYAWTTSWFFLFEAKSIPDFMESVFWSSRSIMSLSLYSMFIWYKPHLIEVLDNLDTIVKKRCKKQIRRQIYENFDRKAKTMAKYICITVFVISPVSYVVPIVMKSYYDYFVLNTSTDAFLLFYPTKLPYNWKTSMGYLAAISFQMFNFLGVLEIFVTFLVFYVGICKFLLGFAEDIKGNFHALEQSSIDLRENSTQITKQSKLYTKIRELVTFHGDVTRFTNKFATFYKKFIALFFLIYMIYLCIFLLRIQTDIHSGDILNIYRSVIRMLVWVCGIFLICRLGDDVNGRFHEIAKMFYSHSSTLGILRSDKRLSKMITIAKQPIYLYGCFNIRCIHETFREMSYATFACFMVIREAFHRL